MTTLSAGDQAAAQADDPFTAYLQSRSNPDTILRAALATSATGSAGGNAAAALVAANALRAATLTGAGATAVIQAADSVASGPADRLGEALSVAEAAQQGVASLVQEPDAGATATQATGQAQATNPAATGANDQVAEGLATQAANAAALNTYAAATRVSAVDQAASTLAADATAKYMGAGALALNQGPGSAAAQAAAAYQALQDIIPAVIATPSSPPLSANTGSTRQGYTPANPSVAPARRPAGRGTTAPFEVLDLTA